MIRHGIKITERYQEQREESTRNKTVKKPKTAAKPRKVKLFQQRIAEAGKQPHMPGNVEYR